MAMSLFLPTLQLLLQQHELDGPAEGKRSGGEGGSKGRSNLSQASKTTAHVNEGEQEDDLFSDSPMSFLPPRSLSKSSNSLASAKAAARAQMQQQQQQQQHLHHHYHHHSYQYQQQQHQPVQQQQQPQQPWRSSRWISRRGGKQGEGAKGRGGHVPKRPMFRRESTDSV